MTRHQHPYMQDTQHPHAAARERLFTVEQANAMLPLLRRIVEDVVMGYRR